MYWFLQSYYSDRSRNGKDLGFDYEITKQGLAKRISSTTGNKAKLQSRLRESKETEGVDLSQYEFYSEGIWKGYRGGRDCCL